MRRLLAKVGPLVAPSANPDGKPPARTIAEARKYFGLVKGGGMLRALASSNGVDFYVDGGAIRGQPSKLVQITDRKVRVLRK